MVYKKYIKRNGKFYGPYIYNSRRVNGKVISEYHGVDKKDYRKFILPAFGILFLIFIAFFMINFKGKISGNVIANSEVNISSQNSLIYPPVYFTLISHQTAAAENSNQSNQNESAQISSNTPSENQSSSDSSMNNSSALNPDSSNSTQSQTNSSQIVTQQNSSSSSVPINSSTSPSTDAGSSSTASDSSLTTSAVSSTTSPDTSSSTASSTTPSTEQTSSTQTAQSSSSTPSQTSEPTTTSQSSTSPSTDAGSSSTASDSSLTTSAVSSTTSPDTSSSTASSTTPSTEQTSSTPTAQSSSSTPSQTSEPTTTSQSSTSPSTDAGSSSTASDSSSSSASNADSGAGAPITGGVISNLLKTVSNFFLGLLRPTGMAVSNPSDKTINGEVSVGNPFTYTLSQGESVQLVPGSVKTDTKSLPDSAIVISFNGNNVLIETNYSELNTPNIQNQTQTNISQTNSTQAIINFDVAPLTSDEEKILENQFGNYSIETTKSELFNGKYILGYQLGDYNIEYSYDPSINNETLKTQIENDKIKWLRDIVNQISKKTVEPQNYSI